MKRALLTLTAISMLSFAVPAHAKHSAPSSNGYFFLSIVSGTDSDNDGDSALTTTSFSTQSACDAAVATASNVVQGCVATCDPANPTAEYVLEQFKDGDKDGTKGAGLFHGIGSYGFKADCEAGVADAAAAGVTDVLANCTVIAKPACQ